VPNRTTKQSRHQRAARLGEESYPNEALSQNGGALEGPSEQEETLNKEDKATKKISRTCKMQIII